MTRATAAALAPAPTNDGRVFFLALEPHGLDLRLDSADFAAFDDMIAELQRLEAELKKPDPQL